MDVSNNKDIILYIQPAYNYYTKEIEYAEVLVRRYMGIKDAFNILKFVKDNGIEEQFDLDIIKESLEYIEEMRDITYPIGINLCPKTVEIKDIAYKIINIIKMFDVNPSHIVLEINEGTNFSEENVNNTLRILREYGISIALDDFGIEKSNLASIAQMNIDIVKVDKYFVSENKLEYERSRSEILKTILSLCNSLNLKHIIEGIETKNQLKKVQDLGYQVVQGFLYEKPLPIIDFINNAQA